MTVLIPCPSCGHLVAADSEVCGRCGTSVVPADSGVHPGETLRDPDDLSLPDSPLLRAVVRGDTDPALPRSTPLPTPAPAPPPLAKAPVVTPTPVLTPTAAVLVPPAPVPPSTDQAAVLRDLAERLQTRKVQPTVQYAGFFIRAVAFLIDAAVLVLFAVPLTAAGYFGLAAGTGVLGTSTPIEADETLLTILTAAWFAMGAIYFTVLHRAYGQSIGKAMLGLEVRALDLRPIGIVRSLIRTLGYAVSSMFLGFGFILVALTPRKRGWHDVLAGTCVVRLPREEVAT